MTILSPASASKVQLDVRCRPQEEGTRRGGSKERPCPPARRPRDECEIPPSACCSSMRRRDFRDGWRWECQGE